MTWHTDKMRRKLLFLLIPILVIAFCGCSSWKNITSLYSVTAELPDAVGMNVRAGVAFGELSNHSLLTITACQHRKVVTMADGSQYGLGEPIAIHIMPETTIMDRRGRWFPVTAHWKLLQPGQTIIVRMKDFPVMLGEGMTAASIAIVADGEPESCDLQWLTNQARYHDIAPADC